MGLLDIGQAVTGIGGAWLDYLQGQQDREYWQNQTKTAIGELQNSGNTTLNGTDQYQGLLGLTGQNLAGQRGVLRDAISGSRNIADVFGQQANDFASTQGQNYSNALSGLGNAYNSRTSALQGDVSSLTGNVMGAYGGAASQMASGGNQLLGNMQDAWQGKTGALQRQLGSLGSQLDTGYTRREQDITSQYGTVGNQINRGYDRRLATGMDMLQGMGSQAAKDIRNDFRSSGNTQQSRLASSGLANSTVASSMMQGNNREMQDSMGRLNDQLREQALNTYTGLSGDALASRTGQQQGLAGLQASLSGDRLSSLQNQGQYSASMLDNSRAGMLNSQQTIGMSNLANQNQLAQNRINSLQSLGSTGLAMTDAARQAGLTSQQQGINDLQSQNVLLGGKALDMNLGLAQQAFDTRQQANEDYLSNSLALGMMPIEAQQNTANSVVGARLGFGLPPSVPSWLTGANQALTNMRNSQPEEQKGGSFFFFVGTSCVDARENVYTQDGLKSIDDVHVGDEVVAEDGKYHKVIAKDVGYVRDEQKADLLCISTSTSNITLTPEHILQGRPAGEWAVGDTLIVDGLPTTIEVITSVPYTKCGDLMLEGNVPYIVNGFVVYSMIGHGGIDKFRDMIKQCGAHTVSGIVIDDRNPTGVWVQE